MPGPLAQKLGSWLHRNDRNKDEHSVPVGNDATLTSAAAAGSLRAATGDSASNVVVAHREEREQSQASPAVGGTTGQLVEQGDRGREADTPTELTKLGWKDVAARTAKQVKQDNLPLAAAGVAY